MPPVKTPPPPPPLPPREGSRVVEEDEQQQQIPEVVPRNRTPKNKKLEEAVAGIYVLIGGAMSTLPPQFVPMQIKAIGLSLAGSSEEIASAWVDLAEDDPKVRKALESLTSFSGWGKVAGVHLMAIGATAVPGIAAAMPQATRQTHATNGGAGMSQDDMTIIMALGDLMREAQSERRAATQAPMQQQQQQQQPIHQDPRVRTPQSPPQATARPRAGMPSAADMGVSIADAPVDFPGAGAESIRG